MLVPSNKLLGKSHAVSTVYSLIPDRIPLLADAILKDKNLTFTFVIKSGQPIGQPLMVITVLQISTALVFGLRARNVTVCRPAAKCVCSFLPHDGCESTNLCAYHKYMSDSNNCQSLKSTYFHQSTFVFGCSILIRMVF